MEALWQERHFGFVHWANPPSTAAKTVSTSASSQVAQLLFASTLARLDSPSCVPESYFRLPTNCSRQGRDTHAPEAGLSEGNEQEQTAGASSHQPEPSGADVQQQNLSVNKDDVVNETRTNLVPDAAADVPTDGVADDNGENAAQTVRRQPAAAATVSHDTTAEPVAYGAAGPAVAVADAVPTQQAALLDSSLGEGVAQTQRLDSQRSGAFELPKQASHPFIPSVRRKRSSQQQTQPRPPLRAKRSAPQLAACLCTRHSTILRKCSSMLLRNIRCNMSMYMILPHLDARDLCYLTQARKLRRCAGHIADGPYIDLNADVPEEAQVAAVMVLYAAYYTQQCSPRVRIYASPAHVQALRTVAEVRAQTPWSSAFMWAQIQFGTIYASVETDSVSSSQVTKDASVLHPSIFCSTARIFHSRELLMTGSMV